MEKGGAKLNMEATVYHNTSVEQHEEGMRLLEFLSPQPNGSILDLGCGTGRFCKVLSERVGNGGKVVGVDPDEDRIKIAITEGKGYNNIQFMVGSDQTFPEDQYDIVVAIHVIHWIKDKEATFKRVYDNLKPGGKFGFTTFHGNATPDLLVEIAQLCGPAAYDAVTNSILFETGEYFNDLAKATGFNVSLLDIRDGTNDFPSLDAFIDFYYGVFYGKFDRTSPALDDIKKRYEGQPMVVKVKRLTMVLTKPCEE